MKRLPLFILKILLQFKERGGKLKNFALLSLVVIITFGFSSNIFALGFGWCPGPKCPDDSTYVHKWLLDPVEPNAYINTNSDTWYDGSFDLSDGGMGTEDLLLDADLKLYIWDDDWDYYSFKDKEWKNLEYGQLTAGGGTWGIYSSWNDTDTRLIFPYSFDVDAYIGDDLVFNYTVGSTMGDFYLKKAKMDFEYCDQPDPVPEPATMLLMGTGLVGLAGFGRKKFFKK